MPPEFAGQNICGACEGDGKSLKDGPCRFCGGTGDLVPTASSDDEPRGHCVEHGDYWTDDCVRCGW